MKFAELNRVPDGAGMMVIVAILAILFTSAIIAVISNPRNTGVANTTTCELDCTLTQFNDSITLQCTRFTHCGWEALE